MLIDLHQYKLDLSSLRLLSYLCGLILNPQTVTACASSNRAFSDDFVQTSGFHRSGVMTMKMWRGKKSVITLRSLPLKTRTNSFFFCRFNSNTLSYREDSPSGLNTKIDSSWHRKQDLDSLLSSVLVLNTHRRLRFALMTRQPLNSAKLRAHTHTADFVWGLK